MSSLRGGAGSHMGSGESTSSSSRFQVSVHSEKGGRNYMEDEYIIKNGGRFAAVFDGHGGSAVSLYLRQNLYASYLQAISKKISIHPTNTKRTTTIRPTSTPPNSSQNRIGSGNSSSSSVSGGSNKNTTPSLDDCIKAFQSAFQSVDKQVQQVSHWSYQGSTAVAIYLFEHSTELNEMNDIKYDEYDEYDDMNFETGISTDYDLNNSDKEFKSTIITTATDTDTDNEPDINFTLISLNVGDSRAILSRDGNAISLTVDHKPNDPLERRRIESLGGRVTWCGLTDRITNKPIPHTGIYRMNGNLALSRAIGDRSERPCVSAAVDIKILDLNIKKSGYGGDEFIVLGSDGLWDVMKNQEVVDFIHDYIEANEMDFDDNNDDENESHNKAFGMESSDDDLSTVSLLSDKSRKDRKQILKKARRKKSQANVAKYLIEEALRRGSTDNVTVIVIWLNKEGD